MTWTKMYFVKEGAMSAFVDELMYKLSELKLQPAILHHMTEGIGEVSLKVNETTKYIYIKTRCCVCNTAE
jgi:hypothetical protein